MKTLGTLTALALAALGGTALAADLPSRKGPVAYAPIAPIFTWTGLYAGVNAGGLFTDNRVTTAGTAADTANNVFFSRRPGSLGSSDEGFTIGGQIGYNYQFGNLVAGLEADIAYTDLSTTSRFTGTTNAVSVFRQELDYLGTVRGRLGYAYDRFLIYATGGLAYGDVSNRATFFSAAFPNQIDYIGGKSDMKAGYTVGGGVEYAFTNNLSAKAEYLYYDLGKSTAFVARQAAAPTVGSYASRFRNDGHIVRVGLNYRFNTF